MRWGLSCGARMLRCAQHDNRAWVLQRRYSHAHGYIGFLLSDESGTIMETEIVASKHRFDTDRLRENR
jgi:hypothetical protein